MNFFYDPMMEKDVFCVLNFLVLYKNRKHIEIRIIVILNLSL